MQEPATPCASFGCAVEREAQFAPVGRLAGHPLDLPLALALSLPLPSLCPSRSSRSTASWLSSF
eukprot:14651922-Heterocapsa_arctica.AAC.1